MFWYKRSIADRVDGGPIPQVMQSTNTLRGEWSEPHIWGETGQKGLMGTGGVAGTCDQG